MTRLASTIAGTKVRLAATVTGGDGRPAKFRVTLANGGATVAELDGAVAAGRAEVEWLADLHDQPLPADVVYRVFVDGATSREAPPLRVDPPGTLGTAGWLVERTGDGTPGPLAVVPDADVAALLAAPPRRDLHFTVGDTVLMRVEVADPAGQPLRGDFELVFALQKRTAEGAPGFATVEELVAPVSAPDGVEHVVVRWVAQRLEQPPPLDFRFVVWWRRKPGAAPETERAQLVESP